MPHKHKRKRGTDADFELPPDQRAQPLPVRSNKVDKTKELQNGGPKKKRKPRGGHDDAPRAFRRLMALASGEKRPQGQDDGDGAKVKTKPVVTQVTQAVETPTIRPGEDLRSFAVRVNAALPISGLARKSVIKDGKDEMGIKVKRTRKERKMHKLYDQWHAEERKIWERKEEELEREAEKALENDAEGITSSAAAFLDDTNVMFVKSVGKRKKGSKAARRKAAAADEDPWLELKKKRAESKSHLHDVVQAPPELHKKSTRQLRMDGSIEGAAADVDSVPRAAGSLKRREELQTTRDDVIEAYRKIREHEQAKLDKDK